MKTCTRWAVENGEPSRVLDLSFVDDGHEFGLNADGTELHVEGSLAVIAGLGDEA